MQQILIIKDKADATIAALGDNFIIGPEDGPFRLILHRGAAEELAQDLCKLLLLDAHADALGALAEAMDKRLAQLETLR